MMKTRQHIKLTFSVTESFTPSHSWKPQQWQNPQEQQRNWDKREILRITAIFTTEKLTHIYLRYNKKNKKLIIHSSFIKDNINISKYT